MLRWTLITALATALAAVMWIGSKTLALVVLGVTGAGLLARWARQGPMPRDIPDFTSTTSDPPRALPPVRLTAPDAEAETEASSEIEPILMPSRAIQAMDRARFELGQPESETQEDIVFHTQLGKNRLKVGYHNDTPFVALRTTFPDEAELTFVIRRTRSNLGLPRVVDNTRVDTANFEYRLRHMEIADPAGTHFEAATNRPRLFRELMQSGLQNDLQHALFDPRYRIEDLNYGGDSLTVIIQPAADPSESAFATDCITYARPFTSRVAHFLQTATIPSAQS